MHSNTIIIACTSLPLAQDIMKKICSHNAVQVSISHDESDLVTKIISLHPSLVLIEDCFLMGITAYVMGRIHDKHRKLRFAVFSYTEMTLDRLAVFLNSGAASFINFRLESCEYMNGLNIVLSGDDYVPENIIAGIKKLSLSPLEKVALTKREIEILVLLADGNNTGFIASTLGITPGTLKFHKSRIYAKCGIHNMVGLGIFACEMRRLRDPLLTLG